MKIKTSFASFLFTAALLLAFVLPIHAELKAPQSVKAGLRVLNQVVGHTGRLIDAKDWARVGGEHGEFTEGAAMLREGLRGEPTELIAQVEPALEKAIAASAAVGEISKQGDEPRARAAHAAFDAAVKDVLALFPEDLRPKPRKSSTPESTPAKKS